MFQKKLRIVAAAVSVILMLGLFTACGPNQPVVSEQPVTSAGQSSAQQTAQPEELPPVTIKMYFPGDRRAATDEVWKAVEEKTKAELNASFAVNFVTWDDYSNKISMLMASGDDYDMNYDASWLSFSQMVNKEAYLDLKDLAPKYMPNYYKELEERGLVESAMANGQLLCIPWTPIFVNKPFVKWDTILSGMNDAGLGDAYAIGSIQTMEDLDAALQTIKEKIPNKHYWDIDTDHRYSQTATLLMSKYGYDYSWNFHSLEYKLGDPNLTLVPLEDTEIFAETAKWNKKWVDEGITPKDCLTNRDAHYNESKEMKVFQLETMEYIYFDNRWNKPEFHYSELYPGNLWTQRSPIDNLTCINRNAANPERTLMFLDMLSTQSDLYDLVIYGVEGKTYVNNGDAYVFPDGMTNDTSNYMDWSGQWGLWRDTLMKPSDIRSTEGFQKNIEFGMQPNIVVSPTVSFFPDSEAVKNELAQRDAIFEEYGKPILFGLVDDVDAAIADYKEKQKAVGTDKIVAEIQRQLNEYKAANQ